MWQTTADAGVAAAEYLVWVTPMQAHPIDGIGEFTGRTGTTSERIMFRWLSGKNRWPQERQRRALEMVTGLTATDLGSCLGGSPRPFHYRRTPTCSVASSSARPPAPRPPPPRYLLDGLDFGAPGLLARHDYVPLSTMTRGVVSPGREAPVDR